MYLLIFFFFKQVSWLMSVNHGQQFPSSKIFTVCFTQPCERRQVLGWPELHANHGSRALRRGHLPAFQFPHCCPLNRTTGVSIQLHTFLVTKASRLRVEHRRANE